MRLKVRTDWGEHKGMQKIKILVAMHKAYSLPGENIYAPIQVGGVGSPEWKMLCVTIPGRIFPQRTSTIAR